ncbi:MAG: hypothetical protein OHK0013_15880 [Sandaracinaceae bacterium]
MSTRAWPLIPIVLVASGCPAPAPAEWTPAFDAEPLGWLMNVAARAADDVWIVGGTPARGVALHYDGRAWEDVAVPTDVPLLNWAMPFTANDVLMVGNGGTVLRWDGVALVPMESGTEEDLWGVWGATPDNVWAVGGTGFSPSEPTLLHFDGTAWAPVSFGPLERANVHAFFKVWGSGPDDVWVVGQRGVVLHFDGVSWREELVGASDDLVAVWGTGPDDVVMVGGRSNGIVTTWDGASFVTTPLAPLPGLNGVWLDNERVFHVAGNEGTVATVDRATLAWTDDPAPATRLTYHSITGDPSGRLWAVGGSLSSQMAPFRGIASTRPRASTER